MLTELEVSRSWRQLVIKDGLSDEVFQKAENLLDELRPESPLRHRLATELDELRNMFAVKNGAAELAPKKGRRKKLVVK